MKKTIFHDVKLYVEKFRLKKEGYIYLFKAKRQNIYKLGHTKNIKRRLKSLQASCPFYLMVAHAVRGSMQEEKTMHKQLSKYSIKGEWYKFDDKAVWLVRQKMDNYGYQQDIDFCMEYIIDQKKDDLYMEYKSDEFIKKYIKSPLFIKQAEEIAINEVNRIKKNIMRYD